jgi:hypothetical protein
MYASDAHVPELLGEDYVQKLNRWRYALARDLYPMDVRRVLHINAIQLFAPDLFKTLKPPKENFVKGNGSKGLTDKHWKRKKKQDQKKRMKKHKEKQSSR